MRGERTRSFSQHPQDRGSSPHTRGTLVQNGGCELGHRFIPAYAGNATEHGRGQRAQPVHPRIRGERHRPVIGVRRVRGSSPHTRGTRHQARPGPPVLRFIPACAGNASRALTRRGPTSVHPRMRGERTRWWSNIATRGGLSPHTRGTLERHRRLLGLWRFIPAYARHASEHDQKHSCRTVHPRMRGERSAGGRTAWACLGSSPHARGTPGELVQDLVTARFIPAYAGNASGPHDASGSCAVHPRIRGERKSSLLSEPSLLGSSPHARGTRSKILDALLRHRFIPACEGNAAARRGNWPRQTVHPRMRGERSRMFGVTASLSGSSPHARGTPPDTRGLLLAFRFIPACAGNATAWNQRQAFLSVHPRMRGERFVAVTGCVAILGSSPHARGTPAAVGRVDGRRRFIPACAGNARQQTCVAAASPVHPRMRGERLVDVLATDALRGSSPHARGTLPAQPAGTRRRRFIPTCAGNAATRPPARRGPAVHPRMRGERVTMKIV